MLGYILLLFLEIFSGASAISEVQSNKGGKLISLPPPPKFTGSKLIPDSKHPYRAPGPDDQRGPCPGLNTLANHGYIPRNGIASFEEIVIGVGEGYNMERNLAGGLTAFGMLARGNPYVNLLSIGGPSHLIPPLPGKIDGPVTKGIATHGRFEGDVSMTRQDFDIGDNRHFQNSLFDTWLITTGQFGGDDPITGNRSIITPKVMAEFKARRYFDDKAANPNMKYNIGRFTLSYGETGFTLEFFANGTTGLLSVPTLGSFFRNQTFPKNWHRRASPASFDAIANATGRVFNATSENVIPGSNVDGKFVIDPALNQTCAFQKDIIENSLPGALLKTNGTLKKNVDFLIKAMNLLLGDPINCPDVVPKGPSGV